MTLIAAFQPPDSYPIFLSDTLLSNTLPESKTILSPNGVVFHDGKNGYGPASFRQKSLVIGGKFYVSYSGSFLIAYRILKALKCYQGNAPLIEYMYDLTKLEKDELDSSGTAFLVSYYEEKMPRIVPFGSGFHTKRCENGLICVASGSAAQVALNYADEMDKDHSLSGDLPLDTFYARSLSACSLIGELTGREILFDEFNSGFGGIIEITRSPWSGFDKLPKCIVVTEVCRRIGNILHVGAGNFLKYIYANEILAFETCCLVREQKIMENFGGNVNTDVILPPHCGATPIEVANAKLKLGETKFADFDVIVFSFIELQEVPIRRITVTAPNVNEFKFELLGNNLSVSRTKAFVEKMAMRYGADWIVYEYGQTEYGHEVA